MFNSLKTTLHKYRTLLLFCVIAFLLGIILPGSFYLQLDKRYNDLDHKHQLFQGKYSDIVRRLAAVQMRLEVLKNSEKELRQIIDSQAEDMAEQEKALDFYRQIMVVNENQKGLNINSYTIKPLPKEHDYSFTITFVQYAKKHYTLKAGLEITLEGILDKEQYAYNLNDISVAESKEFNKLRFKYFQVVEGQLRLPEGFTPKALIINADIHRKNAGSWQRELKWVVTP